jgi:hypothetical protein
LSALETLLILKFRVEFQREEILGYQTRVEDH